MRESCFFLTKKKKRKCEQSIIMTINILKPEHCRELYLIIVLAFANAKKENPGYHLCEDQDI